MSIINDALKKANEEKDKKAQEQKEPLQITASREALNQDVKLKAGGLQTRGLGYDKPKILPAASGKKVLLSFRYIYILCIIVAIIITAFIFSMTMLHKPIKPLPGLAIVPHSLSEAEIKDEEPATQSGGRAVVQPPTKESKPETPEFELNGIVHGKGSSMVVINGTVYTVGDIVKTAKILQITEETVILEKDTKRIELRLK